MNRKCHHRRNAFTLFALKTLGRAVCVAALVAALSQSTMNHLKLIPVPNSSPALAGPSNSGAAFAITAADAPGGESAGLARSPGGPVIFTARHEMAGGLYHSVEGQPPEAAPSDGIPAADGGLSRWDHPVQGEGAHPARNIRRLDETTSDVQKTSSPDEFAGAPFRPARAFGAPEAGAFSAVRPLTEGPPALPLISLGAVPQEGGIVQGAEGAVLGEELTVTATPNEGFIFSGWRRGGETVSTDSTYTFMVTQQEVLLAFFSQEDPVENGGAEGEGGTNLVWQHTDGTLALWEINGPALVQSAVLTGLVPAPDSRVAGLADFNQDGQTDILFQNDDGSLMLWFMEDLEKTGEMLLERPEPGWRVAAVADFDGSGRPDILLQHPEGLTLLWVMDQTEVVSQHFLNDVEAAPEGGRVAGVADFDGDGNLDIVWEHGATDAEFEPASETEPSTEKVFQRFAAWLLKELEAGRSGHTPETGDDLPAFEGPRLTVWRMQGLEVAELIDLHEGQAVPPGWRVAQVNDLDGTGNTDIYWMQRNGNLTVWHLTAFELAGSTLLEEPAAEGWQMVGVQLPPAPSE